MWRLLGAGLVAAILATVGTAGALPEDRTLAYTVWMDLGGDASNTDIAVARRDGTGVLPLITGLTEDYDPSWSPKGERIAFVRRAPCAESGSVCAALADDVWVAEQDGAGAHAVTRFRSNLYASSPSWSPDGSRIAYCRGTPVSSAVWVSRSDRPSATRLSAMSCDALAWSPRGRTIAVARTRELVRLTAEGKRGGLLVRLPRGSQIHRVAWSPDGSRIAIGASTGLYLADADGSALRRRVKRATRGVAWSAAGTALYFANHGSLYRIGASRGIPVLVGSGNDPASRA